MTCLISIDMADAFNSVDWNLLKAKISLLTIPAYLKSILFDFLQDRSVSFNRHSKVYNKGIPQGFSLGPMLWNIFVNDLLETDFGPRTRVQAFADDILIMIQAPASYCFRNVSREALSKLDLWTKANDMTVNHSKCAFTILSSRNYSHILSIKLDINIQYTKQLKYLGLIIDPKLSWNKHLTSINDKINNLQQKFFRLSRATWGLSPQVKKDIFNKVTEKIIAYGHEIWFQNKLKQNIRILQLQRSGLLSITKCYKTVSTDALQVMAGFPPLGH
ncbi:putative 115 kDa protein in type-1 retrotransposable element R1DM [Caerostris darwini]|uniref:115 kDa protein in type-1 retrotransposable element R1DM n=1 Tax=Caerostris darwini TaxID=1538125 RepID=A0AAV4NTG9_9ARAC|nr:putative 115 kDa protein in type-1 retrotransposable element R1DM [Caerostris darwini]